MSILPRTATSPELTKLRSGNQSSRLFATFHRPATVYSARLASAPTSNDNVSSIAYNSGSGTYTNILADMRIDVGTTAGAYDLGTTRVLNLSGLGATSGTINIERTSEIAWDAVANPYITILDAFDLRPRPPYVDSSGALFMDTSTAYVDQHSKCKSTPIFPRYSVHWLPTGGITNFVRDGSQSWALNNTINSYSWTAQGYSSIGGDATSTCTITYNTTSGAAGFRVALTVGNTDGVSTTGYGRLFVLSAESDAYEITMPVTIQGSYQSGGWSAQITMYFNADRTTIRDRAMVILHRKDWYGPASSDAGSLGYVADDENIELVGWIAGESIKWLRDDLAGYVTFTIHGPQYWLDRLTMPPVGLKNISSHAPTNWKRFTGLTAKSMTWHILHWRTTAPVMMDCFAANSDVGALQFQSTGAQTVWQQISNVLNDFIMAKPTCDSYARLFMQTEQNLLSASARSSIPTVMTVTKEDWVNEIDFDRKILNNVAGIDLNGAIYDGTNETQTYALCPGRTFSANGANIFQRTRLATLDQASLNTLAGAAFGWKNPNYPNWKFVLGSNMHMIDLAPYQYLSIDIASSDTPRGITVSGLRLIPRDIKRTFADGVVTPEVSIEAESTIFTGITGDTPPTPPPIPTSPPPTPILPPPPVPVPTGNAKEVWFATATALYWAGDYFSTLDSQPTWNQITSLPAITPTWFSIARDGSSAYLADASSIWQTMNPKSATPAWTRILNDGDPVSVGGVLNAPFGYYGGPIGIENTILSTARHSTTAGFIYGEYNGSAWSWYALSGNSGFVAPGVGYDSWVNNAGQVKNHSNSILETLNVNADVPQTPGGGYAVVHHAAGPRYLPMRLTTSAHIYLHIVGGADTDLGASSATSQTINTHIRLAQTGAQVYCVASANGAADGVLWLSDDGSSFSNVATWAEGWVEDALLTGGGSLVWILQAVAGSNVPARLYERNGTGHDKTGNFWSLTAGSQTMIGMGLVY